MRYLTYALALIALASLGCKKEPVGPTPVASVDVSPGTLALEVGDTRQLQATPRAGDGSSLSRPVSWSSANPNVATVSTSGLVTAVTPGGPALISASAEGVTGSTSVTVSVPAVAQVIPGSAAVSVTVNTSVQLTATARDSRGNALTGRVITWASGNEAIASVSASGLVTGVSVGGPVVLTATSEGKSATTAVTVTAAATVPPARVIVTAPAPDVNEGSTVKLSVSLEDAAGNPLVGRTVTWSSDAALVAEVNAAGLVQAKRTGVARIRARSMEGVEGTVDLAVRGLVHRWTFEESGGPGTTFRDEVNGALARIVEGGAGAATATAGQVTLAGGPRSNADYIALPTGLLRGRRDATIEVWATLHSLKSWSRLFDIGSGPGNSVFIAWSQGTDAATDRSAFALNNIETRLDNSLAPFLLNVQHHVVMSIDEGGGAGGKTRVALYLDGDVKGTFDTDFRLRDLADDNAWLGRSQYAGDETANASYEELRIHDRVYPDNAVRAMFLQGPLRSSPIVAMDILPPAGMRDTVRGTGVRFRARVVGRDAMGRQYPLTNVTWSSSQPSVLQADPTGMVTAANAGRGEIVATWGSATSRWSADVVPFVRRRIDPFLATPATGALWEIPVVLVAYIPTADGVTLDVRKSPDFWCLCPLSLDSVEQRVLDYSRRKKMAMEQGSRYHGFMNPAAKPSLGYRVIEHIVVYELAPPESRSWQGIPGNPRFTDWFKVFADHNLAQLINDRGVREIWFADSGFDAGFPSYDPAIHKTEDMRVGFESNMSSPLTGDISNSFRWQDDLPILNHTYVVYGIAFRRSQAEAIHNVGHQLEAMLSHAAWLQDGSTDLFWKKFVGQNAQGEFVTGRAGWTHMPPNTTGNYDYLNPALVASDIEDWRPDGTGAKKMVNLNIWGGLVYPWPGGGGFGQQAETQWYTYWMQNFPGRGNQIPHGARWMTNWWAFVGNWDAAMTSGLGLHGGQPAAVAGVGAALSSRLRGAAENPRPIHGPGRRPISGRGSLPFRP